MRGEERERGERGGEGKGGGDSRILEISPS